VYRELVFTTEIQVVTEPPLKKWLVFLRAIVFNKNIVEIVNFRRPIHVELLGSE
jgi:hypothetical protein